MSIITTPSYIPVFNLRNSSLDSAGVVSGWEFTDNGDGTMTVTPGVGYARATADSESLPIRVETTAGIDVTPGDGVYTHLCFEYDGTDITLTTDSSYPADDYTHIYLGSVYRHGTTLYLVPQSRNIINDHAAQSNRRHRVLNKMERIEGAGIVAKPALSFAVDSGRWFYGFSEFTTTDFDFSTGDTFELWYYDGAEWVEVEAATALDSDNYNDITSGLAAATPGEYVIFYVFIHPADPDGHIAVLYGQDSYTSDAADAAPLPLGLPDFLTEARYAAKIKIAVGAASFTDADIKSAFTTPTELVAASAHNSTTGKQGGDGVDFYHSDQPINSTDAVEFTGATLNLGASNSLEVDGSTTPRSAGNCAASVSMTPTADGDCALDIQVHGSGYIAHAIHSHLSTGALGAGDDSGALLVTVDSTGAVSAAHVDGLHVSIVGDTADVAAVHAGADVAPIHQVSGSTVAPNVLTLSGVTYTDITAEAASGASDATLWALTGDSVLVGHTSKASELHFDLATPASNSGIKPAFTYWNGSAWTAFSPTDGTRGARRSGVVSISTANLTGFALTTLGGYNRYWYKITRTAVTLATPPVENTITAVVGTEYEWDKLGNLIVKSLTASDGLDAATLGGQLPAYYASATDLSTHAGLTTAHGSTSANTASRIVQRDSNGDFSAGTITASLTGTASGNIAKSVLTAADDVVVGTGASTPGVVGLTANTVLGKRAGAAAALPIGAASGTDILDRAAGDLRYDSLNAASTVQGNLQNHLDDTSAAHAASAISVVAGSTYTGTTVADQLGQADALEVDRSDTGLVSWGAGTTYYTVSGTNFTVDRSCTGRIKGKLISFAGGQSIALTANATNYIFSNSSGVIAAYTTIDASIYLNNFALFEVYRDPNNHIEVVREDHPFGANEDFALWGHLAFGPLIGRWPAQSYQYGVMARVATGTGGAAGDRQVKFVGNVSVLDHGLISTLLDTAGAEFTWHIYYTNGSGQWTQHSEATELPALYNNAGTPTALATTGSTDHTVYRLYASKDDLNSSTPKVFAVMDSTAYATVAAAQSAITANTVARATSPLIDLELAQLGFAVIVNTAGGHYIGDLQNVPATIAASFNAGSAPSTLASGINTDTSAFNGALSAADTNVQLALNTLDDKVGQDVSPTASPSHVALTLTQTTGTKPLTISSTTLNDNLNADLLDGFHASKTAAGNLIPVTEAGGGLKAEHTATGTATSGYVQISTGPGAVPAWGPQTVGTSTGLPGGSGVLVYTTSPAPVDMAQNETVNVQVGALTIPSIQATGWYAGTAATNQTFTDWDFDLADESKYTQEDSSAGTDFSNGKVHLHLTPASPNFAILLHGDGTDGSTTIVDTGSGSQGHTWTANGNVQIDTAQSVFGGSSWLFDGTGDNLELAATSDMSFAGDGGISLRVRFNSLATFNWILNNQQSTNKFVLVAYPTGEIELTLDNASVAKSAAGAVTTGTWYHIQMDRVGTAITIRKNGTTIASGTKSGTIGSSSSAWYIGKGSGGLYDLNGWIDEFAVLNGSAINSSDFTSPVAAYSDATYPLTGYYVYPGATIRMPVVRVANFDSITITQTEPTNTTVRYLLSWNDGSTWKDHTGATVALANIHTSGSTSAQLVTYFAALTPPAGSSSLIVAVGLKTTDATVTPSVSQISFQYDESTPWVFENANYTGKAWISSSGSWVEFKNLKTGTTSWHWRAEIV